MLYQNLRKENTISLPKSFEWFCDELSKNNIHTFTVIGDYKNMRTALLVRCNECGNEWMAKPQHLLRGHGCKKCALMRRDCSNNKKKTTEIFIDELKHKNADIEVVGEYINAKTHIDCKCLICGCVWSAKPTNLLAGCGCPECGHREKHNKQIRANSDFVNIMGTINSDVIIIGEYAGNHTPVRCMCKKCHNEWFATPANLMRRTGCPLHSPSHGEASVRNWLLNNGIIFETQKKFDGLVGLGGRLMPYDFYIPDYNVLIEYQGNFHDKTDRLQSDTDYRIRIEHDRMKRQYAVSNGIKLVEIWYYDNIEEKLQEIFGITNPVTTTVT